jgi:hypothetical protein
MAGNEYRPWVLGGIQQWWQSEGVSHLHRLRLTDRIFFANVNRCARIRRFSDSEYALMINVLESSRQRLGFLLCGYVLIPQDGTGTP